MTCHTKNLTDNFHLPQLGKNKAARIGGTCQIIEEGPARKAFGQARTSKATHSPRTKPRISDQI